MRQKLVNFIAFQLGWFSCVIGAAKGAPQIGALIALGVLALHLATVRRPAPEARLIALAVTCGLLFDSLLVSLAWLQYPNGMLVQGTAPYWILAMWAMFATTLNVSMGWMRGRLPLAIVMGGVFGPLSYLAGARLGGLTFVQETPALIALAIGWAVIMPFLVLMSQRLDGVATIPMRQFQPAVQSER